MNVQDIPVSIFKADNGKGTYFTERFLHIIKTNLVVVYSLCHLYPCLITCCLSCFTNTKKYGVNNLLCKIVWSRLAWLARIQRPNVLEILLALGNKILICKMK